jgi:hypothetical protein
MKKHVDQIGTKIAILNENENLNSIDKTENRLDHREWDWVVCSHVKDRGAYLSYLTKNPDNKVTIGQLRIFCLDCYLSELKGGIVRPECRGGTVFNEHIQNVIFKVNKQFYYENFSLNAISNDEQNKDDSTWMVCIHLSDSEKVYDYSRNGGCIMITRNLIHCEDCFMNENLLTSGNVVCMANEKIKNSLIPNFLEAHRTLWW